ncbi:Uncharacterised protein [Acinetobacter baumannii]|nr:Uncharacterised protein [Acinetobacter baumannii]
MNNFCFSRTELRPNFFYFRDHVTRTIYTYRIANAYIQTMNFPNIMQRYVRNSHTTHKNRV